MGCFRSGNIFEKKNWDNFEKEGYSEEQQIILKEQFSKNRSCSKATHTLASNSQWGSRSMGNIYPGFQSNSVAKTL
jgi:hypothetical protein